MVRCLLAGLLLISLARHAAADGDRLAPPVRIFAAGEIIDVEGGFAAPFVCDWDEDGRPDLLVGRFGCGKLRIFRNLGAKDLPLLEAPETFRAGGTDGTVPSG